jgi:hypothetical protein
MKDFIHKILSTILSLILVFSTLSFTVEKHECGGKITDVSIFSSPDKCSPLMEMEGIETSSSKELSFNKHQCCKDLTQIVQSNLVVEKSTKCFEIQVLKIVTPFEISIKLFEGLAENVIPFQYYIPQKIITDIPVLFQTFLI